MGQSKEEETSQNENMKWRYIALCAAVCSAAYEALMWGKQLVDRDSLYSESEEYAHSVNKQLLVIGNPKGRHSCGDINVDISGSECPVSISANVEDLSMFNDKRFGAVFVGHVLEHVDDIEKAYSELCRVADKVFIAYPDWYSVIAYAHPGHKWLILSAPPDGDLRYIKLR